METTVVLRADADKAWEAYEEGIKHAVHVIEIRHGVSCIATLDDHPADLRSDGRFDSMTENWLNAADAVAVAVSASGTPQLVPAEFGSIEIRPDAVPAGTFTFTGATQRRYLLRETFIVPASDRAWSTARRWFDAYQAEGSWLDADLAADGLPALHQFWS